MLVSAVQPCESAISIYTSPPSSFPGGSDGKESAYNVGDLGSIPGLGRSPGEGKGYPLQYSGLENFMDSPWVHKEWDTPELLSTGQGAAPAHMLF